MNISLEHKRLQADKDSQLVTSFIVERFEVPSGLSKITMELGEPFSEIESLLVYDSGYNLRVEIREIQTEKRITICEDELETTMGSISGPIPEGDWVLVFQLDEEGTDLEEWYCDFQVLGQ